MKETKAFELIKSLNIDIEYDKVQKTIFPPKQDVHYLFFKFKGTDYVYSETNHSYCFSKIINGYEKMICATTDLEKMIRFINKEFKLLYEN